MDLKNINDNPLSREWKERYAKQPPDVQKKLDELEPGDVQLEVIKRKRIVPKTGDVFLVSPVKGIYFYGIVLNDNPNDIFGGDLFVIIIFKTKTREQTMDCFKLDFDNILIRPSIVGKEYWTRGYFYNIGKIDLDFQNLDYGFYSIAWGKYYNEYEEELNHIPKYLGSFGVSTIIGIAFYIQRELIMDSSLLED